MAEPKTSERRLNAVDKQRQALELRRAGYDFDRIAAHLGYRSRSGAYQAVMAGLDKTLREPAEELRQLQFQRLEAIIRRLWPLVASGNLDAVDRILKALAQESRIMGLDNIQEMVFSVEDVESIVREIAQACAKFLEPEKIEDFRNELTHLMSLQGDRCVKRLPRSRARQS